MSDLFSYSLQQRLDITTQWDKINALIDWQSVEHLLISELNKHRKSPAGRKGYAKIKHFKALLLGE